VAHTTVFKPEEDAELPSLWAKLLESCKKLQVFFARSSGLTDLDLEHISAILKANSSIKVFDISANPDLSDKTIVNLCDVMAANRSLEYLGLSKLNITTESITPLFNMIGRFPFPED